MLHATSSGMIETTIMDVEKKERLKTKEFGSMLHALLNLGMTESEKNTILDKMSVIENNVRDLAIVRNQNKSAWLRRDLKSQESIGMKKCNKQCKVCSFIDVRKDFRSKQIGETFHLKREFNCNTTGDVYMTSCAKCGIQYVGQTKRKFCDRMREYWYSIVNKKDTANGIHFNSKNHTVYCICLVSI